MFIYCITKNFCTISCLTLTFSFFEQYFVYNTDDKFKRRLQINFKLRMCFSLNWYLKTPVSPPVFYIILN